MGKIDNPDFKTYFGSCNGFELQGKEFNTGVDHRRGLITSINGGRATVVEGNCTNHTQVINAFVPDSTDLYYISIADHLGSLQRVVVKYEQHFDYEPEINLLKVEFIFENGEFPDPNFVNILVDIVEKLTNLLNSQSKWGEITRVKITLCPNRNGSCADIAQLTLPLDLLMLVGAGRLNAQIKYKKGEG